MMVIKVLLDVGGTACLREVVRRVATLENGSPPSRSLRKSVYTSILQNHIPKMKHAGLIEYNKELDALHLLELPENYRYHLEEVENGDLPWCGYYLVLSIVGIVSSFLVYVYTGIWSASLVTIILSLLLFFSALVHTTRTYNVSGNELLPRSIRAITKRVNRLKKRK
jgi:hypothetical protein